MLASRVVSGEIEDRSAGAAERGDGARAACVLQWCTGEKCDVCCCCGVQGKSVTFACAGGDAA